MKKFRLTLVAAGATALWLCIFAVCHFGCSSSPSADLDGTVGGDDTGKPSSCSANAQCRNNIDCGTGTCNGGVCKCGSGGDGLCYKNEECTNSQCCNIVANKCYDCGADTGVNDTGGTGDTGPLTDSGPTDVSSTDTGGGNECSSDFQCPDLGKPYCNIGLKSCVQCYQDAHCPGSTCDTTSFTCVGGGTDGGTDTGVGIDTGVTDAGSDPCTGYSCLCDSYCMVSGGTPSCVTGCRNIGDCCAGKDCVNGYCQSTTCGSDADCSGGAQPHCNTSSGSCVECVYDSHCANGFTCNQGTYICEQGSTGCNPPCDASSYCDPNTLTCMPANGKMCQPCTSFVDCLGGGEVLTCGFVSKICTKQCVSDTECAGSTCGLFGYCCM